LQWLQVYCFKETKTILTGALPLTLAKFIQQEKKNENISSIIHNAKDQYSNLRSGVLFGGIVRKSADGKKGKEDCLIAGYQYCGHYYHHSGHHYAKRP